MESESSRYIENMSISSDDDIDFSDEFILIDINYITVNDKPRIILYTRDKNRKRSRFYIDNYHSYFYTNAPTVEILDILKSYPDWLINVVTISKIAYDGGSEINLQKIIGRNPWYIPKIRKLFMRYNCYEADIPYTHRFLIDNNIFGLNGISIENQKIIKREYEFEPIIMGLDIEIDSSSSKDHNKESLGTILINGNRRITAISLFWGKNSKDTNSKVFILDKDDDTAEKITLNDCFKFIWNEVDPDIIVTYNGDSFDLPYLVRRVRYLGMNKSILSPYDNLIKEPAFGKGWIIPGVLVYDIFKRMKWLYTSDGRKSLSSVSQQLLGMDKNSLSNNHSQSWRNSLNNIKYRDEFIDYAQRDAQLTYLLFFARKMEEWLQVIKISGLVPSEGMYYTERQTGEFLVFRHLFQNNTLIPKAPSIIDKKLRDENRRSVVGGLVLDPNRSLSSSVLICDFTSMYPSIISAHNIGAESYEDKGIDPRLNFKGSPRTSMAIMQDNMLNRRINVKKKLIDVKDPDYRNKLLNYNRALKLVANSTFGSYNFTGSRFYNFRIGLSITTIGRNYMKLISKTIEELGDNYRTIYGDTDSIFIETPLHDDVQNLWNKDVDEISEKDLTNINKVVNYLKKVLPDTMRLELQDVAYRILFHEGAKKRYTFISAISKKIHILGLEAIRHDWSEFSKDIQKYAINIILETGDLKRTHDEIIYYIRDQISDINRLKIKLIRLGPLKKNPNKYKSITPALGAFKHYCNIKKLNPLKEWKNFDHFPFLIIKGKGPLFSRSRHPNLVEDKTIDLDHYISRSIAAINRFNVDVKLYEIHSDKFTKLADFFDEIH